jgi:hypothetical protein
LPCIFAALLPVLLEGGLQRAAELAIGSLGVRRRSPKAAPCVDQIPGVVRYPCSARGIPATRASRHGIFNFLKQTVKLCRGSPLGGSTGEFPATIKVRLIFPEGVRVEVASEQFMIRVKMTGNSGNHLGEKPSIPGENVVRSRPDDVPFSKLVPGRAAKAALPEVVVHIVKPRKGQNSSDRDISDARRVVQ